MLHDSLISSQTTFHWGERPLLGTLPGRAGATFGPCSVPGLLLLVYLFNCCVVLVVQSPFPVLDIISIVEVEFDPIDPSRDRFGFQIPDWIVGQIEGMLLWSIPVRRFRALHLMRLWWSSVSVLVNPWSPTHRDERCLPVSKARDVKCGVTWWDYMDFVYDIYIWFCMNFWLFLDFRPKKADLVTVYLYHGTSQGQYGKLQSQLAEQGILHFRDMAISPNSTIRTKDSWLGRCRLSAGVERLFTRFLQIRHQDQLATVMEFFCFRVIDSRMRPKLGRLSRNRTTANFIASIKQGSRRGAQNVHLRNITRISGGERSPKTPGMPFGRSIHQYPCISLQAGGCLRSWRCKLGLLCFALVILYKSEM